MKLTPEHGDVVSTESLEAEIERRIRLAIEPLFSALETWVRELGNVGQRPIDDPLVAEWNAMHSRLDKLIASDDAEEAAS